MSEISPVDVADQKTVNQLKIATNKNSWLGQFNDKCSEFCSSILVKETRQALKSREFIWTYCVLLVCVGSWAVLGLTFSGQQYEAGGNLLNGFFMILGFPLGIVIPFSAYRSLAREFEDGTISLISITTMKPYQIVVGKFGSAILQTLVFLSVLAPCICCTYLLRGVSIGQIVFGLSICVGASVALTILGLFLAGAFRSRTLGVGVSVLFILLLGWLFVMWCILCEEMFRNGSIIDWGDPGMVEGTFFCVAFFGSLAAMLLVAAASQISFPSDNRSTGIRIAMVVQQMLFFAFVIIMLPEVYRFTEFLLMVTLFAGHYWLLMGFLMIGESSTISRRVQRTLPRTPLTRSFFSLFMPGAGRGYLFAIANFVTSCICLLLIWNFTEWLVSEEISTNMATRFGPGVGRVGGREVTAAFISLVYVAWFLSLVYLIMNRISEERKREWGPGVGPMVSLLIGALLVAFLSIGSAVIHYNFASYDLRNDISPILVFNWYWSIWELDQNSVLFSTHLIWHYLFWGQAILVIGFAMGIASRELLCKPIAVPERVAIDLEKRQEKRLLPAGESLDEIFGEARPSRD
ncbi:MAG: ABC transporter permease [Mariniblastus sp.]